MSCIISTRSSRCSIRPSCSYPWRWGTSTRSDPKRDSCGGDSHPEESSPTGRVGLARAYPLTNIKAMRPSRLTRSSYDPPYPLGRWSSGGKRTALADQRLHRREASAVPLYAPLRNRKCCCCQTCHLYRANVYPYKLVSVSHYSREESPSLSCPDRPVLSRRLCRLR